jgi:hypothetical protein
MLRKVLSDGNVWFTIGLLAVTVGFAIDRASTLTIEADFFIGLCDGIAIVSFAISILVQVIQHARKYQEPAHQK